MEAEFERDRWKRRSCCIIEEVDVEEEEEEAVCSWADREVGGTEVVGCSEDACDENEDDAVDLSRAWKR